MRRMGGIWRLIPWTYAMMWIGSLALAGVGIYGVFGFAGFYSKDIILESAFADHTWFGTLAFWLGVAAAALTARSDEHPSELQSLIRISYAVFCLTKK